MFKLELHEDPTNSMEILNVLIYENEFKLKYVKPHFTEDGEATEMPLDKYRPDSMSYLVDKIGQKKCFEIISGVFVNVFEFAVEHNYLRYVNDFKGVDKVGCGYWTSSSIVNALKKVQKHLEIYYLNYIYNDDDETLREEYNKYFGKYTYTLPITDQVKELDMKKRKANENAKAYNEDLVIVKKYLKDHPEFGDRSNSLYEYKERISNLSELISPGGDMHYTLSNISLGMEVKMKKIKEFKDLQKEYQEELDYLSDRSKSRKSELNNLIKSNNNRIMELMTEAYGSIKAITRLGKRIILTEEQLSIADQNNKDYYHRIVSEMNDTYGYERYKII